MADETTNGICVADAAEALTQRLHYCDHGWRPLPEWACFFIRLGAVVALPGGEQGRTLAAASVPTRAYAAALCAAGVVLQRCDITSESDDAAHLALLRSLPSGATVTYRRGNTGALGGKGWLMGCEFRNGMEYFLIHTSSRDNYRMPIALARNIQPAAKVIETLPATARTRTFRPAPGLLSSLGLPSRVTELLWRSRLDCVAIGNETMLRGEIHDTPFASLRDDGRLIEGHLQDVVRARDLGKAQDGYRVEILPASGKAPRRLASATPHVVVFDGATSFGRWASLWPQAHQVIILDRTERQLEEVVSDINGAYLDRRAGTDSLVIPQVPNGVECVAFTKR